MLLNNLQFQLSKDARDVEIWPGNQLRCIRTTEGTIEFLRMKPNGSTSVMVVEGINLCVLRPAIVHNFFWRFEAGLQGPPGANVFINRVYPRLGWTVPKYVMAANPNPVPMSLVEFETGKTRDLWLLQDLEAFAVDRSKATKFLFQFYRHAYVLDCPKSTFASVLAELKNTNLHAGMVNKFSAIPDHFYPRPTPRFSMASIELRERDISNQSSWEILYPPERVPGAPRQSIAATSIDW